LSTAEEEAVPDLDTVRRAQQRIGTVIRGKYRIDRVLGIGGMGVVYAATHRNRKQFAVKMLHSELSFREDIRKRFLREGYASNSVKHPGAVAVMDDDVAEDGSAFLIMEMLEGASVEELWEKQRRLLPLGYALAIIHQLLDVLAAAHANGVVHRDIKPANIFLTFEGQVKVLDFGIARVRDMAASGLGATSAKTPLGTPAFMSPEQALARSGEIDAQTDVWAAGATLFALISGHLVHEGDSTPRLLVKVATTSARSLATVSPETPAPVIAVVDRALAYQKNQRWPTAVAMRDAVRDANLAAIGRVVGRDSLLPLFAPEDLGVACTRHAEGIASTPFAGRPSSTSLTPHANGVHPVVVVASPSPGFEGPTAPEATPLGAGWPPFAAGGFVETTTAPPISSTQAPSLPPGVPKKRGLAVVGAGLAGVVGLVTLMGSVILGKRAAPHHEDPPTMAFQSASQAVSRPVPAADPPKLSDARLVDAIPPSTPTASRAVSSVVATTKSSQEGVSHSWRTPVPASLVVEPAGAAPPIAAPIPASVDCDPPYVIDAAGHRQYKPECLK
jgi:serine/threonine protein kinase